MLGMIFYLDGKGMTQYLVKKVAMRLLVMRAWIPFTEERKTIIFIKNDHSNLPDGSPDKIYCDEGEDEFAYISESDGDITGDGCEHINSFPQ